MAEPRPRRRNAVRILAVGFAVVLLCACAIMATATPGHRESALSVPTPSGAAVAGDRSPNPTSALGNLYRDKNGYFALLTPAGWRQEDFPQETVRSKVRFYTEDSPAVIELIVGPTASGYSYDRMLAETKAKGEALKRQFGAGSTVAVSRGQSGEEQTVLLRASAPGTMEMETVLILNPQATVAYTISYSASSQTGFDAHRATFQALLQDLQILEPGRAFTEKEPIDAAVSKKRSLAQLSEQAGQYALARQYVQEGLALDPGNADMKEMEERLKGK